MVVEKFQIHGVKQKYKKQRFLYFSLAQREEDYGAEKITKIKLARVLVTSFDKFYHFCNHYIFGFCSVVP